MPTQQFIDDPFVKAAAITDHFDITGMTLWRWIKTGQFPKPRYINGVRYWKQSVIEQAGEEMSTPDIDDHPWVYPTNP